MKIKLSKSQWEQIGKETGWKKAQVNGTCTDESLFIKRMAEELCDYVTRLNNAEISDDAENANLVEQISRTVSALEGRLIDFKEKALIDWGIKFRDVTL